MDNVVYDGIYSVTFTNEAGVSRNTWTDWGLIPSTRPSEPRNSIWSNPVTIPGVNGQEDLVRAYPYMAVNSDAKFRSTMQNDYRGGLKDDYGYDIYQPTSGSISFVIADQSESFFTKHQKIVNFLHGRIMAMVFTDNPSKTYTVRTTVESVNSGATYSSLGIAYTVLS